MKTVQEKGVREICRWIYIFLMGVLLLWYLYSIATFKNNYHTPGWVKAARCTAAVMAVWLGKLWKERSFRFLLAFWALLLIRVCFPTGGSLLAEETVQESLLLGVWLFAGCFGLPMVLDREELKRFLTVVLSVWTAGMAVYSAVGIYAAWTDRTVYTIGGTGYWCVRESRLNLVFYATTAASVLCLSSMTTVGMIICAKKVRTRLLLIPALALMLTAMSLTDARTARIVFSFGMGGMACAGLIRRLRKDGKSETVCRLTGILGLVVVSVGTLVLLGRVTPLFNMIKVRGGILIRSAAAEAQEGTATLISSRGIDGLTGREEIWGAALQYLWDHPIYLLTGTSLYGAMDGPNGLATLYYYPHCHNTLLQVLLESGIPGLLMAGGFVGITLVRGSRLIFTKEKKPLWALAAAVVVFAMWVGELGECFIVLLRHYTPTQALVFIGMGMICVYGRKEKDRAITF